MQDTGRFDAVDINARYKRAIALDQQYVIMLLPTLARLIRFHQMGSCFLPFRTICRRHRSI